MGEQRSEVVEQYDAAMTSVAGVKGLLKLSSVGHANLVRMQRAGRYEETEWAAIARGDAPGTQANMGLVNLGDGLFRQREMHEAEHYYVRHVQKRAQGRAVRGSRRSGKIHALDLEHWAVSVT